MHCTVEVSKVDGGSYCAGYNTIKQATASASLITFAFGGYDCMLEAGRSFIHIRESSCRRVSYQPALKEWTVTIRKH